MEQVEVGRWGRVRVLSPGKHGEKDRRVEFNGVAPSLAETIFLVAGILRAEDRYDKPGQLGRLMFWDLLDEARWAEGLDEIYAICERAEKSVKQRRDNRPACAGTPAGMA